MGRYVDGDVAAFQAVYDALAPVLLRCLLRWVSDRALAEDLVQETFLRVHRARDTYRTGAPVGPWVLTIGRRLAIDAHRRRSARRERGTSDGRVPEVAVSPEPASDEPPAGLIEAVRAAVEALPESQRRVVAMHKLEGRSMAEVARVLGINEGAARVRAHRGYARLRAALAGVFAQED